MRIVGEYGRRLAEGLRQSLQEKPGALILCDSFQPAPGEPAHGVMAAQVARQQGFRGPLVAVNFEDPQDPAQQQRQQTLAELVQRWGEAADAGEIARKLYDSMVQTRLNLVESATDRLLAVAASGVRHAALNLSLGSTPALCVTAVLDMCQNPEIGEQAQSQLARVFGDRIQEGLVEVAQRTSADERLLAARQAFAQSVVEFEKSHNSVVVAAGNDGNIASRLKCPGPDGFTRSDLVTPQTTVVGATENGQRAAYTGDPGSVTAWAEGAAFIPELGQTVHGTSFASPRIAAEMAALHATFPESDSAGVEARLTA